jgi:hypothetical protein
MGVVIYQVVAGEIISVQLEGLADSCGMTTNGFKPTFPVDIQRKFDDI